MPRPEDLASRPYREHRRGTIRALVHPALAALFAALALDWSWNAVAPAIWKLPELSFQQSLALLLLIAIPLAVAHAVLLPHAHLGHANRRGSADHA